MKTWLTMSVIVLSSLTLSGCIAAALVGGGAAGGYYLAKDKGSAGAYTSDSVITSKVKSRLLGTPDIRSFDISVSTAQGVVSLSGILPTAAMRMQAIEVARTTKGVKAVDAANLHIKQ